MTYEIVNSKICGTDVADDASSIQINVTIRYRATGAEKTEPSSVGGSFTLSLQEGERNTMVNELNSKIFTWFQSEFNS